MSKRYWKAETIRWIGSTDDDTIERELEEIRILFPASQNWIIDLIKIEKVAGNINPVRSIGLVVKLHGE